MTSTRKTTRTTEHDCVRNSPECEGAIWECRTCKEWYCQVHSHTTEKGANVECARCERERQENSMPDIEDALGRINKITDSAEKLDIGDKPDYRTGR